MAFITHALAEPDARGAKSHRKRAAKHVIYSETRSDSMTSIDSSETLAERVQESPAADSILKRIAHGDPQAVNECLNQYGNFLWSLAKRYCGESEAEDAVQEIFVELWRTADRFDSDKASEMTFVAMIARRRLIDRRRRGGRVPDLVSIDDAGCDVAQSGSDDHVELSDEAAKAGECLKKLSEKQQQVLSLSIEQAQPHAVIADRLKMPLGTVKSYARRGLLQLRECMQRPLSVEAT